MASARVLGLVGSYRDSPEAFQVEEVSGWQASGDNEHLLCEVEKIGLNGADQENDWPRSAGHGSRRRLLRQRDRHAVAAVVQRQRRSDLRGPIGHHGEFDALGAGWRLLSTVRHAPTSTQRSAANRFRLELGLSAAAAPAVPSAMRARSTGAGRTQLLASTLRARVCELGAGRTLGRRGALASSRKSARIHAFCCAILLFNEVVAARVRAGTVDRCADGDVSEATFNGPLWGRGRSATDGAAAEIERAALEPWSAWCSALEHAGLTQERRPLLLKPEALEVEVVDDTVILAFTLAPGAFATALLPVLGAFADATARAPTRDAAA